MSNENKKENMEEMHLETGQLKEVSGGFEPVYPDRIESIEVLKDAASAINVGVKLPEIMSVNEKKKIEG